MSNFLFHPSFFLLFAFQFHLAPLNFAQLTTPQNISGTFGLQLNSYPQQSSPYSASSFQASTGQSSSFYDQRYPTQTDHYGYPSPEQLAQIPAPPLRQQQFTNPYSPQTSSPDWRGTTDPWRTAAAQSAQYRYPYTATLNPEQSITNNNNIPYSQPGNDAHQAYAASQYANRLYGQGAYQPATTAGGGQQQYGQGQPIYGQQTYGGEQSGGNIGLQQLMPNRDQQQQQQQMYGQQHQYGAQTPLNPQYQSPSGRIVFPGNSRQQQEEQNRHSFWFNSAAQIRSGLAIWPTILSIPLIAFLL